MSAVLQRGSAAMAAALVVWCLIATGGAQQGAPSPWSKAAAFPEPAEEWYGAAVNGKMYVMGGIHGDKGIGGNYEYDPSTDKWTKKKAMPRPAHHAALAAYKGKIYVCGGFVFADKAVAPFGWVPIDDLWEYDPAADTWKALAPLPDKRGAAVAVESGGKIYVIGGATTVEGSKETFIAFDAARVLNTNAVYDPATNKWEPRKPMAVPRNHASAGAVNGKIYVIGGRAGHAFITFATNTDAVEEYDPAADRWSPPKRRMPTPRSGAGWGVHSGKIYVAGGEVTTDTIAAAYRAVEAYEPATDTWTALPSMPMPRHGVAGAVLGDRLHLATGMITSSGAMGILDKRLELHTSSHDVLDLSGGKAKEIGTKPPPDVPVDPKALRVRRNVMQLTPAERKELVDAIHKLKKTPSPYDTRFSYYDQFVSWHLLTHCCPRPEHPDTPWPAHFSPGIWPWHRILLVLFEQALKDVAGKTITVPYWDWTDPKSVDVVFADDFFGPKQGDPKLNYVVTTGPFRKEVWPLNVISVPSEDPGQSRHLVRAYGKHDHLASLTGLPTAKELADAMTIKDYDVAPYNITSDPKRSFRARLDGAYGFLGQKCSADGVDELEFSKTVDLALHSAVHQYVAGAFKVGDDMWFGSLKTHASPNDPVFFLHHAFLDKVWADWMARHGRQYQPEGELAGSGKTLHGVPGLKTPLRPFDRILPNACTAESVLNHNKLGYAYDTDKPSK